MMIRGFSKSKGNVLIEGTFTYELLVKIFFGEKDLDGGSGGMT